MKRLTKQNITLKGIVSQDFRLLQMILMQIAGVSDIPLDVYLFLNFRFIQFFQFKIVSGFIFYYALSKNLV